MESNSVSQGLRYNEGKLRMDLIPPEADEELAKILTKGAKKYAPRNWELGMKWSTCVASLKRHLLAWEKGEDLDPETGESHMSHILCNAAFLVTYIQRKIGEDDRVKNSS